MILRQYHSNVPDRIKDKLERDFSTVTTFEGFVKAVSQLAEPLRSTILQPVMELTYTSFLIEGKPNWKAVNPFKKKYEIRRGVRLPFSNNTILNESTVWAMRSVVTKSADYKAFLESLPLQMQAERNGFGSSSYACILYIFDILAERANT